MNLRLTFHNRIRLYLGFQRLLSASYPAQAHRRKEFKLRDIAMADPMMRLAIQMAKLEEPSEKLLAKFAGAYK